MRPGTGGDAADDEMPVGQRRTDVPAGQSVPTVQITFERIYAEWFDQVARWVQALGVSAADREDVVQDVFLVVHRRLEDFDGQNVVGWLYQIARHKVRDYRRLAWVKHIFGGSRPVSESTLSTLRVPLDALETKEKGRLLERLLATLNEDQSAAFVLFEIEGNSGEEIARLQGVPLNTVWARIYKARQKLRKRLCRLDERAKPGRR